MSLFNHIARYIRRRTMMKASGGENFSISFTLRVHFSVEKYILRDSE